MSNAKPGAILFMLTSLHPMIPILLDPFSNKDLIQVSRSKDTQILCLFIIPLLMQIFQPLLRQDKKVFVEIPLGFKQHVFNGKYKVL